MFDNRKLQKTKFTERTETISTPELADFFGDGVVPEFVVKSLTGEELYSVNDASSRDDMVSAAITGLYGAKGSRPAAIRDLFGIGENVPEEFSRRLEMLILGTVSPEIDRESAVKLSNFYPATVKLITDKIINLTGAGYVPGKQKGSGDRSESDKP